MPQVVEAVAVVRQLAWAGAVPDSIGNRSVDSSTTSCIGHRVAGCNNWYTLRAAQSIRIAAASPCYRD